MTNTIRPPAQEALDLDTIRDRAGAATGGPWGVETVGDQYAVMYRGTGEIPALCGASDAPGVEADAAFIASSRADVPALLAEVERLRADLETERAVHALTARTVHATAERAQVLAAENAALRADRDRRHTAWKSARRRAYIHCVRADLAARAAGEARAESDLMVRLSRHAPREAAADMREWCAEWLAERGLPEYATGIRALPIADDEEPTR